jgi:hypothetical protein
LGDRHSGDGVRLERRQHLGAKPFQVLYKYGVWRDASEKA